MVPVQWSSGTFLRRRLPPFLHLNSRRGPSHSMAIGVKRTDVTSGVMSNSTCNHLLHIVSSRRGGRTQHHHPPSSGEGSSVRWRAAFDGVAARSGHSTLAPGGGNLETKRGLLVQPPARSDGPWPQTRRTLASRCGQSRWPVEVASRGGQLPGDPPGRPRRERGPLALTSGCRWPGHH